MHHRCEIILPPTEGVEGAVTKILDPFSEHLDPYDDDRDYGEGEHYLSPHAFWDWWVIGGRYSGAKFQDNLDPEKFDAFNDWIVEEKVMVSAIVCGKQELADFATVQKVDAKWQEMFPGMGEHCYLFRHAGDSLPGDILTLKEVGPETTAARVIIANAKHRAVYMTETEYYNGVTWQNTTWDGKVHGAIEKHVSWLSERASEEYKKEATPTPDWLVVTVDLHS